MSQASKAFLADPVEFMRKNIVNIPGGMFSHLPPISKEANFDLINDGSGFNSKGESIPAYRLVTAEAGASDPIPAYWLAYTPGGTESKILDTSRDIFFTTGLTGCGFVAGSGAKPVVKHVDGAVYKNDEIIDDPSNAGMDIYTEANYHDEKFGQATVFGVKGKVSWQFMAQARLYVGGKPKLRFREGVMPV